MAEITESGLKFLRPKVTIQYGYDEVCTQTFKVIAPKPAFTHEIYDALRIRYHSYCTHSHDCCGCRTYSYSIERLSRREFKVNLTIGRNY